ncbi:tripartite tricarboxylate transporter substrate binding protein [Roseomonas sp. NAR14]|uniref:Tripartite tricarboxylate transporter substrate binding protein n=1 Tax=Roseomonas acroporae TaxID=2937791 RepID=A0A9X1Y4D4_9PROT|nr:tripartite tricarboxylate transporter substrate binding protein [Roseomonas acroporae]MCK8783994.1 tripartite tricarboxylate transporter substrate binding protein [Roseomonas acroporae]
MAASSPRLPRRHLVAALSATLPVSLLARAAPAREAAAGCPDSNCAASNRADPARLDSGSVDRSAPGAAPDRAWPTRPVTLTIGYAPGGLTDVMVRLIAERLSRELGQPVVVENRTGAATALANTAVANARPDGQTLLIGTNSLAINLALTPGATPRDPLRELVPVREVYHTPFLLLVHRDIPARTLPGLIEAARRAPDAIDYGSSGSGSVNHLLTALLLQRAGARMNHVPYRGAAPALLDLRAGRIGVFYATPLDARPLLAEGSARAVAISSPERLDSLPDVPSVAETHPGCEGVLWQGLFAPPGTPAPVLARLDEAVRLVLAQPDLAARVASEGVVLMRGDADALRERLRGDIALWARVVRDAGIQPG